MTVPLDELISARVIAFTAHQLGRKPTKVTLEPRLGEDLGVDGDDAAEFFEAFAKDFVVDLSALRFAYHFGPEGIHLSWGFLALLVIIWLSIVTSALMPWRVAPWIVGLMALLCYVYWRKRSSPATIRVLDLVQSAAAGRWIFPYAE
jgi:hypothetical protein